MKRLTILAALAAAGALVAGAGGAIAGELADACRERLAADGRDTSGCDCLEKAVEGKPALIDELTALGEIEDPDERYAAASAEAKQAMACTRK